MGQRGVQMLTQTMGTVRTGQQISVVKSSVTIDVMLCNTVVSGIGRSCHKHEILKKYFNY